MKGNEKLIDTLNSLLEGELTAINQYIVHAEMCEDWGYGKLSGSFKTRAITEMKHAEKLIERILFLEGTPIVSNLSDINIGKEVPEQVKNDHSLEVDTVKDYNEAIVLAGEAPRPDGPNVASDLPLNAELAQNPFDRCNAKNRMPSDMRFFCVEALFVVEIPTQTRKIFDDNGPQLLGNIAPPPQMGESICHRIAMGSDNARKLIDRVRNCLSVAYRKRVQQARQPSYPILERKVRDLLCLRIHNLEKVFDIGKIIIGMPVAERKQVIGVDRKQLAIRCSHCRRPG